MKKPVEFSFEEENEEKRNRDNRKNNVIKIASVKNSDNVFYVGSLDLIDPYSGKNVYVPSEEQLKDIEESERNNSEAAIEEQSNYVDGQSYDTQDLANDTEDQVSDNGANDSGANTASDASQDDLDLANEIFARLMAEAAADEAAKAAEIEAIKREQEANEANNLEQEATEADYNAETGSYSGLYGKKPMSESESDILASILNTNSSYTKSFDDLLKENS